MVARWTVTRDILHHLKSFFGSLAQSNLQSNEQTACLSALSQMEGLSYSSNEQLLDTEICVEEIEGALKVLKLGKLGGPDGLSPEHMHSGEVLKIWLNKILIVFSHMKKFLSV